MKRVLRHGFTTGACAAAAAKGAAMMLARQEQVESVTIDLPAGVPATFALHGQEFSAETATCYVIKDAGDDPDVTNGAEVHALVSRAPRPASVHPLPEGEDKNIIITGGAGIGRVTKPGLAISPGEWAINPVPRRMIEEAVHNVFDGETSPWAISVEISIPDGEKRAARTLNARLGICGGLSILGTTGIVRPISAKAWTDTIDSALDVARACGCGSVVLSTGRTSEMAAQKMLAIPEEAFIMMGDHIGYSLRACRQRGYSQPIIACQFAKLLKIACGHENTHAAASELDIAVLAGWVSQERFGKKLHDTIAGGATARDIIISSNFDRSLLETVCRYAQQATGMLSPDVTPRFFVADYAGNIVFQSQ